MIPYDKILAAFNKINRTVCDLVVRSGGDPDGSGPGTAPPPPPIAFKNTMGVILSPLPSYNNYTVSIPQSIIMDAAGESSTIIGRLLFKGDGPKTLSAAGGGIYMSPGTTGVLFANAGSRIRAGIQAVNDTTGLEAGVYDVYGDIIGGQPPALISSYPHFIPMATGSKVINNGDLVAITFELVTTAGGDAIRIKRGSVQAGAAMFPYVTNDVGAGPTKSAAGAIYASVVFDDGTVATVSDLFAYASVSQGFGGATATNAEVGTVFKLPMSAYLTAFNYLGLISSANDVEVSVYSDPLGTPVQERSFILKKENVSGAINTAGTITLDIYPRLRLDAGIEYAVVLKPIAAATLNQNTMVLLDYINTTSNVNYSILKNHTALGQNWSMIKRGDGVTGAFTLDPRYLPSISLYLDYIICE